MLAISLLLNCYLVFVHLVWGAVISTLRCWTDTVMRLSALMDASGELPEDRKTSCLSSGQRLLWNLYRVFHTTGQLNKSAWFILWYTLNGIFLHKTTALSETTIFPVTRNVCRPDLELPEHHRPSRLL